VGDNVTDTDSYTPMQEHALPMALVGSAWVVLALAGPVWLVLLTLRAVGVDIGASDNPLSIFTLTAGIAWVTAPMYLAASAILVGRAVLLGKRPRVVEWVQTSLLAIVTLAMVVLWHSTRW
jgi:hypothetical protein